MSRPSNCAMSSVKACISVVQVLVNASGKNVRSTFFWPRKDASVTSVPAVERSVNSGAADPTAGRPVSAAAGHFAANRRPATVQLTTFHQAAT